MSAPLSDVEPETTATAARNQPKNAGYQKAKRSYKTVDQSTRRQLIELVNEGQKTIKEAANRLKINYSTAKHIIKFQNKTAPAKAPQQQQQLAPTSTEHGASELPMKHAASVDIERLEQRIKALNESANTPSIFHSRLG